MAISNYLAAVFLNFRRGTTTTAPTTVYIGWMATPQTAGATGTEMSYPGYGRKAVSWSTVSGRTLQTSSTITGNACGDSNLPSYVGWCIWDASTGGNVLDFGYNSSLGPVNFYCSAAGLLTFDAGYTPANGDVIYLIQNDTGTLPTGTAEATRYYIINASGQTANLSTTLGGSAVTITAAGTGLAVKTSVRTLQIGDAPFVAASAITIKQG